VSMAHGFLVARRNVPTMRAALVEAIRVLENFGRFKLTSNIRSLGDDDQNPSPNFLVRCSATAACRAASSVASEVVAMENFIFTLLALESLQVAGGCRYHCAPLDRLFTKVSATSRSQSVRHRLDKARCGQFW